MIALIEDNREAIAALCEQRLAVFGSAVNERFEPAACDPDFVVELEDYGRGIGQRFMRFIVALDDLVGRPIDVVTPHDRLRERFRSELDRTALTLHDTSPALHETNA